MAVLGHRFKTNFTNMLNKVLHNWNFFRIVRLVLGIMIMVQSIQFREYWFVLIGLVFTGMAIFDMGCAGGSCAAPPMRQQKQTNASSAEKNNITYEEVG